MNEDTLDLCIIEDGQIKTVKGRQFPQQGEVPDKPNLDYFQGKTGVADAFQAAEQAGYRVLYANELGLTRAADAGSPIWHKWYLTASSVMTGHSRKGNPVVVFAHVPTELGKHAHIREQVTGGKLINGAAQVDRKEFLRVLDLEGNGVIVVDYGTLKDAGADYFPLEQAVQHPLTAPFLGADEDTVRQYLQAHKQAYNGRGTIVLWYNAGDLPSKGEAPRGRLLVFGNGGNDADLYADSLDDIGRVLGVGAPEARQAETSNGVVRPTLEQTLAIVNNPDLNREGMVHAFRKLYK